MVTLLIRCGARTCSAQNFLERQKNTEGKQSSIDEGSEEMTLRNLPSHLVSCLCVNLISKTNLCQFSEDAVIIQIHSEDFFTTVLFKIIEAPD